MPTREYYRRQAQVLFELAAKMSLKVDAERLISMANEYQMLAGAMPPEDETPTAPNTVMQPLQQHQTASVNLSSIGEAYKSGKSS